jgi:outer membrane protein assembly factor BamB
VLLRLLPLFLLVTACASLEDTIDAGIPQPTTTATVPLTTTTEIEVVALAEATTTTTTTSLPQHRFVDARSIRQPRDGPVTGLLQFRGNPSRTWYGLGPIPDDPGIRWEYEIGCGPSSVGGEITQWCGSGWTGQPVVWERPDGVTEIIVGAYDHAVHFLNAATGEPTRTKFRTADINKGSVTLDPDGYPIIYFGSRDDKLRAVALDRPDPVLLWSFTTPAGSIWNNDWDGNPTVIDDILFEGGENGIFYAWKLNRSYGEDGLVSVAPELLVEMPSYDDDLVARVGRNVSIEGSVAIYEGTLYLANSGGRVLGLDINTVDTGVTPIVFDYWVGEDVDASVVVDEDGMIYVAAELEAFRVRATEVGQLMKLDPTAAGDPLVWSVSVPPRTDGTGDGNGGLWATPALGDGVLYATTHPGQLLTVDTDTGEVLASDDVGFHAWSSPVVAGDRLLVSVNCEEGGGLRGYDISEPPRPRRLWQVDLATGCIESTPAVWKGSIYVASRDGNFYAFG